MKLKHFTVCASLILGSIIAILLPSPKEVCADSNAMDRDGVQYAPYLEWSLANSTYSGNPYDLTASVTFSHVETGEKRTTEMFYDGDDTWKFRFSSSLAGRWIFTSHSTDADLDSKNGTIEVTNNPDTQAHGFLKDFGNKWGWEGTETAFVPQYVMLGSNSGSDFTDLHNNPGRISSLINEFMVGHGFTGFHIAVVGGRWFDFNATTAVDDTMTNPDPRTFEALEQFITAVHKAGGSVHIWPWGDESRKQTPKQLASGANGTEDNRLIRYIAARLGPIPGWSMGYGFDLDEWAVSPNLVAPWHTYFHDHSGWAHFLGGRPVGPNSGMDHAQFNAFNDPLDYSSYEHHRPTYEVYVAAASQLTHQPVFSEDRFRVRNSSKDYTEEETRRGLYHATMAGGIANIWGQLENDTGIYANKSQLKTYSRFFNEHNRFTPVMARANHLTSDSETRVLRDGNKIVLYREGTNTVHIDLSGIDGNRSAVAVDTTQAYQEIDLGSLSASAQTLRFPRTSDWVIAIGDFSGGNGEAAPVAPTSLQVE